MVFFLQKGLNKLLQKFLIEEIDSIPRRLLSSAQEKELSVDDQQRIQKSFYKLIEDYLTKEFESSLNSLNKNAKIDGKKVLIIIPKLKKQNIYILIEKKVLT